jgi:hypothetical protein
LAWLDALKSQDGGPKAAAGPSQKIIPLAAAKSAPPLGVLEHVLAYTANRADKIIRQRRDAALNIRFPRTNGADDPAHRFPSFQMPSKTGEFAQC